MFLYRKQEWNIQYNGIRKIDCVQQQKLCKKRNEQQTKKRYLEHFNGKNYRKTKYKYRDIKIFLKRQEHKTVHICQRKKDKTIISFNFGYTYISQFFFRFHSFLLIVAHFVHGLLFQIYNIQLITIILELHECVLSYFALNIFVLFCYFIFVYHQVKHIVYSSGKASKKGSLISFFPLIAILICLFIVTTGAKRSSNKIKWLDSNENTQMQNIFVILPLKHLSIIFLLSQYKEILSPSYLAHVLNFASFFLERKDFHCTYNGICYYLEKKL